MNFFIEKGNENANYANQFVEIIKTVMALFFIGGIFYGTYIISSWILDKLYYF